MKATPIRTCIGCGARAAQAALVRVAATPSGLVLDRARRVPGRGGYLHVDPACWTAFVRRRGPVRSLRMTPPVADRERLVCILAAEQAQARGSA